MSTAENERVITVSRHGDGTATVLLDRAEKLNAMHRPFFEQLRATMDELDGDPAGLQQRPGLGAHDSPARMQATGRPCTSTRGGSACVHRSTAREQRGANEQPSGSDRGSGGSPARPAGA